MERLQAFVFELMPDGRQQRLMRQFSGACRVMFNKGLALHKARFEHGENKLEWNGGQLVAVLPQNTSRTCPDCAHVSKDNRRTQARFACVRCGYEENADLVGAINIARAGHARSACQVSGASRPPATGTRRSNPLGLHA